MVCTPLSARFAPNSVNIARYASLIWHKSPIAYPMGTKWVIHLAETFLRHALERIESICRVLECGVDDILEFDLEEETDWSLVKL